MLWILFENELGADLEYLIQNTWFGVLDPDLIRQWRQFAPLRAPVPGQTVASELSWITMRAHFE